jgi:tetratricopeptide (TPR) repeat protein
MFSEGMEFGFYGKAEHKANKAHEFYEDGQMSQALEALDTALEINPANGAWHFDKALALDSVHRFEDAIVEYELALELNPEDLEILNSLAVDYTRTGQYDRAIEMFEHIEQLDADYEPSYCNRIIAYTEMGLHDQAEEMFYMAQQVSSGCALCYYNVGNSLFVRGLYQKAISCWIKTEELEQSHPQINYRIAQAYWYEGEMSQARERFLSELRSNPGDVDVIFDYGLFLLENDEVESAKEKFNRVLEFRPNFAPALLYLGEVALNGGMAQQAVEKYNAALRCDDTLAGPYYRLAQHALMQNKLKKARAYLISELRNSPEDASLLLSIGTMFLTIETNTVAAGDVLVSIGEEQSSLSGMCSDLDHAMHCLLRAVDADPTNPEIYYTLGVASAMREAYEDASEFFSHAVELKHDYFDALRDSALVLGKQGEYEEAIELLHRAKAYAKDNQSVRGHVLDMRIHQGLDRLATLSHPLRHLLSRR